MKPRKSIGVKKTGVMKKGNKLKKLILALSIMFTGCATIAPEASIGTYSECQMVPTQERCTHALQMTTSIITIK